MVYRAGLEEVALAVLLDEVERHVRPELGPVGELRRQLGLGVGVTDEEEVLADSRLELPVGVVESPVEHRLPGRREFVVAVRLDVGVVRVLLVDVGRLGDDDVVVRGVTTGRLVRLGECARVCGKPEEDDRDDEPRDAEVATGDGGHGCPRFYTSR